MSAEDNTVTDAALPTVLLVDDNKEIVNFVAAELKDKYNLLKAYDGGWCHKNTGRKNSTPGIKRCNDAGNRRI